MKTNLTKSRVYGSGLHTSREWVAGKNVMLCPICGCAYIHPCGTRSIDNSQVVHEFWCEDGHEFSWLLSFRKGHMFFEPQSIEPGGC